MNDSSEKQLLMTVFAFSNQFGVTPPQTYDIGEWWRNAVREMGKEDIYLLYKNFNNFSNDHGRIVLAMKDILVTRKLELDEEHIKKGELNHV